MNADQSQAGNRKASTLRWNQEKRGHRSRAFQSTQIKKPRTMLLHLWIAVGWSPKSPDFGLHDAQVLRKVVDFPD